MSITYKTYVSPSMVNVFENALTRVKNNTSISHLEGISKHEVHWTITPDKLNRGKVWFEITVSRPFLIQKIGYVFNELLNNY